MDNLYERYQRQIELHELGEAGQRKLLSAKALVIGAGGLGCPVLLYLAAAGIGNIGIADDDKVSLNNLQRQILYTVDDIGFAKAATAKLRLEKLNPEIEINSYICRLTNKNSLELLAQYDIILDCTDNFSTRYMINDACVLLKKSLVFGAVSKFEGQVAVFNIAGMENRPSSNYRDIFPQPPLENEIKNCEEEGVIGVLPGIIGSLMANETIKLITGLGQILINKILVMNLLTYHQHIITISPNHAINGSLPQTEAAFKEMNYDLSCSIRSKLVISMDEFLRIKEREDVLLVDVREFGEIPAINKFKHIQVPLSNIEKNRHQFNKGNIVFFCQSGKRSLRAAQLLKENSGIQEQVYSLEGGIAGLL